MINIPKISPESSVGKVGRGQQTAPQAPSETKQEKITPEPTSKDILQVDPKRREDARLFENARLLLEELPDIRPERIEEVRRRLQAGFYDRPEALEETAKKILREEPLQESAETSKEDQADNERVQQARRRLVSGYYDQSDVLDETARRILKRDL